MDTIEIIKCLSLLILVPLFIFPSLYLTIMGNDSGDHDFLLYIYLLYVILTIYIWYYLLFVSQEYLITCLWFLVHPSLLFILVCFYFIINLFYKKIINRFFNKKQ